MGQTKKTNLLPSHYRILEQLQKDPGYKLKRGDLQSLERDYRWDAPGVSDDPSMIDFFDTPRSTLFEHVVRVWNSAWLAAKYAGVIDAKKVASIVDVGAGRGESYRVLCSTRLFKGSRINYTALDIDLRKRELFNALYPGKEGLYKICDFRNGLPLAKESVDAFLSTEALEHVTKKEGEFLLREMHKALKLNGHLVLTTPNATLSKKARSVYHAHEWKDKELMDFVTKEVGFVVVEWFYTGVSLSTLGKLVPKGAMKRIASDVLRATLGIASGLPGSTIFCVLKKVKK